jgi:hypothetical protein
MKHIKIYEEFVSNVDLSKSETNLLLNELSNLLNSKGLIIDYKIKNNEDYFRKPDIKYIDVEINIMYDKPLEGFDKLTKDEMISQYSKKFLELSKVLDKFFIKWRERFNKANLMLLDGKYIYGSRATIGNIRNLTWLSDYWNKGLMRMDLVIKSKKFQRVKPTDKVLHFSFRKNRKFIEENGIKMTSNEKWSGDNNLDLGDLSYGIDKPAVYAIQDFRSVDGFEYIYSLIGRLFGKYNALMIYIDDMGWSREDVTVDLWEIDVKGLGYKWYRDSNLEFSDSIKSKTEYDWIMSFDGDIPKESIKLVETFDPLR